MFTATNHIPDERPSRLYIIELLLLFGILPLMLLLPIPIWSVVAIVATGVFYTVWICIKYGYFSRETLTSLKIQGRQYLVLRWLIFVLVSTTLFYVLAPDAFFKHFLDNIPHWLLKITFYTLVSVFLQELIFRGFIFNRYKHLFSNHWGMILFSAVLFSYAHVVFLDPIVFALTFAGGVLFGMTWHHSKSLLLVSAEHAAYGIWLFTMGAGAMLGFC